MNFSPNKSRNIYRLYIAIILIGIGLRLIVRSPISLWEDEIIAVTHATKPFFRVIFEALLTDMHPPLYFLELRIWSYVGHSDIWMIANSVLLSIVGIISIYVVTRRLYKKSDLSIAAVYALLPVPIWMAEEVRMYAFLSILLIWLFYYIHRSFVEKSDNRRNYLWVFLLSAAVIYTHAIGFIAVFIFGIYAASWLVTRHAKRDEWPAWLFVFGGAAIAALPMLLSSIIRQADMTPISGFADIFSWMSSLVIGNGYTDSMWLKTLGIISYLLTISLGMLAASTRQITLCFLVLPILLCIPMELISKPLFKTNFFPNLCAPFFAIVIGSLLSRPTKTRIRWLAIASLVFVCLTTMAVANRLALNKASDYFKPAASIIESQKRPGDVVWAPEASAFWGMAWYLIGPSGESPLTIRAPLKPGSNWQKILDYLGPDLTHELQLAPKSQMMLTKESMPIFTADGSQTEVEKARRVWLVTFMRNDLPKGVPGEKLGPLHHTQSFTFPPLTVNLYEQEN